VSAEADAWCAAPEKANFNRREGLGRRMNSTSGGLRPTVGLRRPKRPLCVGGGRRLARGAPNEFGLQRPSANGRPAPTEKASLRRRRPTPGAQRLGRPISIGVKACADRKSALCVGEGRRLARERLRRPISIGMRACADRKGLFASAEADAWRVSAWGGRFQSAWRDISRFSTERVPLGYD
jgi:hypothetical protein